MSEKPRWGRTVGCLVGAAVAAFVLLSVVVMGVHELGEREESQAREAWQASSPLEDLGAPRPRRDANPAALLLEENAGRAGIALAPRGTERAAAIAEANAPAIAEAASLSTLHDELIAALGPGSPAPSPLLVSWLDARGPQLDALAVEVLAAEPPRWESPDGRTISRSPPPVERSDEIVREAARMAQLGEGPLPSRDEHVTRPGIPRLDGIALLDEALVLLALRKARSGDGQGALRELAAAARVEEGLALDADVLTLGVLADLARQRLAAVRALALPVSADGLLGPALEPRMAAALRSEAASLAREIAQREPPPSPRAGFVKHVKGVLLGSFAQAAVSRTLANVRGIVAAAEGPPPSSADLETLARESKAVAPPWDGVQAEYLEGLVEQWTRTRRADVDAELTRRYLAARVALAGSGDERQSCRLAADEMGADRSLVAFKCQATANGKLALLATDVAPALGPPPLFDPEPVAVMAP